MNQFFDFSELLKTTLTKVYNELKPFKDIIWFLFLFITLDFLWKLCFNEGEKGDSLYFLGKDLTHYTEPISLWTAKVSHWIVYNILGYKDFIIEGKFLYFDHPILFMDITAPTSLRLKIVWDCTGIKQMILFALLLAFYFGPAKKKLWFIPLSMLILNFINIVRIVTSALIIKDGFPEWFIGFNEWYNNTVWIDTDRSFWQFYVDWFQMFHKDVFKWLYYNGVIFLLWLVWQEKYNLPFQKSKRKTEEIKNKGL